MVRVAELRGFLRCGLDARVVGLLGKRGPCRQADGCKTEQEGFAEEHENLRPHHNVLPPNPHVFRGADLDAYARGLMGSPTRRYGRRTAAPDGAPSASSV